MEVGDGSMVETRVVELKHGGCMLGGTVNVFPVSLDWKGSRIDALGQCISRLIHADPISNISIR